MSNCFINADILLPDFEKTDGRKWSVIACDQFTSEKEYWERAEREVGGSPSALRLFLPEAYLDEEEKLLPEISKKMDEYMSCGIFKEYKNAMIYVERVQSDGRVRHGIVGEVDLEYYDWHENAKSKIRATEKTVPERIPPRVKIRSTATLELPHIMLLIDDRKRELIEAVTRNKDKLQKLYDYELMLGGGRITGWLLNDEMSKMISDRIENLSPDEKTMKIAVGDGNHSLATAKAIYEDDKKSNSENIKYSRYALAEVVNVHDEAIEFEPIYRIIGNAEFDEIAADFKKYCDGLEGNEEEQTFEILGEENRTVINAKHPTSKLAVGTLQSFINEYLAKNKDLTVDYIHGIENVKKLVKDTGTVGFIFEGMTKSQLFASVEADGSLPRKTFSMGHAEDKRYYTEARKIK